MTRAVLLFPGQGSQTPGMGKELYDNFPQAREILDRANSALGFDLKNLIFNGPEQELTLTKNAQPALLAVSAAALSVLRSEFKSIEPQMAAGHSLGEYSAIYSAGAISLDDALRVVRKRGELMQTATPEGTGTMAAVMGWDTEKIIALCKEVSAETGLVVEPANMNSAEQVVVSGHVKAVERFSVLAKERGAKRALQLKVSAPFHSSLMKSAADEMKHVLDSIEIKPLNFPVIANVTAQPVKEPDDVRKLLVEQVCKPVLWDKSMQFVERSGAKLAIEVGPGKVLAGLMKRNAPDVEVLSFGAPKDIPALKEKMK